MKRVIIQPRSFSRRSSPSRSLPRTNSPSSVLAERLTAPTETVTDPAGRVTALTSIWKGPGAEPTNDGCVPVLPDSLREATVIAYKEAFDEWLDPT